MAYPQENLLVMLLSVVVFASTGFAQGSVSPGLAASRTVSSCLAN